MHNPAACFCALSYAGLAVNLVQLGSLQMRHESCVALSPASQRNQLFFRPYPACFGSAAELGTARK